MSADGAARRPYHAVSYRLSPITAHPNMASATIHIMRRNPDRARTRPVGPMTWFPNPAPIPNPCPGNPEIRRVRGNGNTLDDTLTGRRPGHDHFTSGSRCGDDRRRLSVNHAFARHTPGGDGCNAGDKNCCFEE